MAVLAAFGQYGCVWDVGGLSCCFQIRMVFGKHAGSQASSTEVDRCSVASTYHHITGYEMPEGAFPDILDSDREYPGYCRSSFTTLLQMLTAEDPPVMVGSWMSRLGRSVRRWLTGELRTEI